MVEAHRRQTAPHSTGGMAEESSGRGRKIRQQRIRVLRLADALAVFDDVVARKGERMRWDHAAVRRELAAVGSASGYIAFAAACSVLHGGSRPLTPDHNVGVGWIEERWRDTAELHPVVEPSSAGTDAQDANHWEAIAEGESTREE